MQNYKALIRLGSGVQWVQVQASNYNHAKMLITQLYGPNFSNLCQGSV